MINIYDGTKLPINAVMVVDILIATRIPRNLEKKKSL